MLERAGLDYYKKVQSVDRCSRLRNSAVRCLTKCACAWRARIACPSPSGIGWKLSVPPPITRRITINAVCRCNFQFCPAFLFPSPLSFDRVYNPHGPHRRASRSLFARVFHVISCHLEGPANPKQRNEEANDLFSTDQRHGVIRVFRGALELSPFPGIVFTIVRKRILSVLWLDLRTLDAEILDTIIVSLFFFFF